MRLVKILLAFLLLVGSADVARAAGQQCPVAALQRLQLPAARAAVALGGPLEIVALGSSSTAGSGASRPDLAYPAQLEGRLRRALPGLLVRVHNLGRGGDAAPEMLARLQQDGLGHTAPTLVIWQAGTNDALRQRDHGTFRTEMEIGLADLLPKGADVVLMDSQRSPRLMATSGYEAFDRALVELASAHHAGLFSRAALMQDWQRAGVPAEAMLGADGLHHNDRGYRCLAKAVADAIISAVRPHHIVADR